MDSNSFFWKIQAGTAATPEAVKTLGGKIVRVDAEQGSVETSFEGKRDFTNPTGAIQGGFLAAMLDDTMGPALAATLNEGEFAPTLNLNVSFHRSAVVGPILGKARIVRRGAEIAFLQGELYQADKLIASAVATAVVRKQAKAT
ncbi:uncharacterized protein (TIGR00369 family) [Variovorax boronicumulans]|uniref:Uncharacterized protein (TIGR00369 family) n=1 Tax=Variovorax boronicumulans TaxID=436515 RepID=A0AAW8DV25_9BURK|nr:PaaI family thioesterase [Variovorax boronicumulans]MDP9878001.1 uncharacterized protein (TIGR00369 family) [Variovorax boronicumulans]MDP9923284.1 uncharacterized protein (TIGR00369 family) [Variovorax boronicumulans]